MGGSLGISGAMFFKYQKKNHFFALVSGGMEDLAQEEIKSLGAVYTRKTRNSIRFKADFNSLMRINYGARFISRILAPLKEFHCRDRNDLYANAKAIHWKELFFLHQTFGITANVFHNQKLTHSKFAALVVKDAIVDHFREEYGDRPNVEKENPDIRINLHIQKNDARINLDTSGNSLHKRGYRTKALTAPMRETLAAAMVVLSGWDGKTPLMDPMCGSGTILGEAYLLAAKKPPGSLRKEFGFFHMPEYTDNKWRQVKKELDQAFVLPPAGLIQGNDQNKQAVSAARHNLSVLTKDFEIPVGQKRFQDLPKLRNHLIISNPPYGHRMGEKGNMAGFYKDLGRFLKTRCAGSTVILYIGDREMIKHVGLKPVWKKPLRNATLDGRVVKYEVYKE